MEGGRVLSQIAEPFTKEPGSWPRSTAPPPRRVGMASEGRGLGEELG